MRLLYDLWYRYGRPPWVGGPRSELVELVESGRLRAGRALDLGCGVGSNVVFLAQHDFNATGLDYARSAIEKARASAREAGVDATFIVADLRRLEDVAELRSTFDLLVDYGTLDDLSNAARDDYLRGVLPLTGPGTQFLLYCFEWIPVWWERLLARLLPFGEVCMLPGEVERRFGPYFTIERVAGESERNGWPRGYSVYLMKRRPAT